MCVLCVGPVAIEHSQLRAPVGCHKEYMNNMGVRASMVSPVAVRCDGSDKKRLWGLVVCHNLTDHYVPYSTRSALGLLVRVFTSRIEQALEMEHSAFKHAASSAEVHAHAQSPPELNSNPTQRDDRRPGSQVSVPTKAKEHEELGRRREERRVRTHEQRQAEHTTQTHDSAPA